MFLLDDAKRRVEGLPPVLGTEKIKDNKMAKVKGQATLESMFKSAKSASSKGEKRKREE